MANALFQVTNTRVSQIAMGVLLLLLFKEPLLWLAKCLEAPEYRLHSCLLMGFAFFLGTRGLRARPRLERFEIHLAPLLVFVAGLVGYLVIEARLQMDVLSCLFCGLTLYGFIGFLMERESWKNSAAFVLLFFTCLPLSYHIETFLGFPLRLASAKIAESFFALTQHHVQSTETILLIENKAAHIDLPCSGIKGLWSISLFSLILSLVEKYKVNFAWILSFAISWLLVAGANLFRIIALVAIFHLDLPPLLKDSLHAPVGLIGFVLACALTTQIFRALCTRFRLKPSLARGSSKEPKSPARFDRRAFYLVALLLVAAVSLHASRPAIASEPATMREDAPSKESLALTEKERSLFLRHGVLRFEKKRFSFAGLDGTAFLVLAKSWRAHHHPEQCLKGQGHTIDATRTLALDSSVRVRSVELRDSDHQVVYWFQSPLDSTDDYSSRVWSGVIHPNRPYVMVSLYIENGKSASADQFKALILDFRRQASTMLELGDAQ